MKYTTEFKRVKDIVYVDGKPCNNPYQLSAEVSKLCMNVFNLLESLEENQILNITLQGEIEKKLFDL